MAHSALVRAQARARLDVIVIHVNFDRAERRPVRHKDSHQLTAKVRLPRRWFRLHPSRFSHRVRAPDQAGLSISSCQSQPVLVAHFHHAVEQAEISRSESLTGGSISQSACRRQR